MQHTFKMVPHTADIKIHVQGATLAELFGNALYGMFQVIGPLTDQPGCRREGELLLCEKLPIAHKVELTAHDGESLLVDFLSEAWYLSDVHNEAYFDADFSHVDETSLKATLRGIPITGFDVVEIKAVTYHEMDLKQVDGRWQTEIVFDI